MSRIIEPEWQVLSEPQLNLLPQLAPAATHGFVLYGGTAIALRLGHRQSVDFDFFTDRPLAHPQLRKAMPFINESTTLQESTDTLTVLTPPASDDITRVKVSFFGSVSFGRTGTPAFAGASGLQVASPMDLMATKLKVLLQRVEAKDYIDLAALVDAGHSLPLGLSAARCLFGHAFQPSESLKALTWFQGGDLDTLPAGTRETLIHAASAVRDLPAVEIAASQLSIP